MSIKHFSGFCAVALALAAASCSGNSSSESSDSVVAIDTTIISELAGDDSIPANPPVETEKFEKSKGNNSLEIEYPVSGNDALLKSIRTWMSEQLGDTYSGDLNNAKGFFKHYAALLGTDPELSEEGGYSKDEFEVEYQNNLIVTYEHSSIINEGGPQNMKETYGTTFLLEDGSIFTKKCIASYKDIQPLIVEGLKGFFKVKSDADLLARLNGQKSTSSISAPAMNPWIEEDGVAFSYTPYEIDSDPNLTPHFTIPFAKILPFLTEEGRRFIQQ